MGVFILGKQYKLCRTPRALSLDRGVKLKAQLLDPDHGVLKSGLQGQPGNSKGAGLEIARSVSGSQNGMGCIVAPHVPFSGCTASSRSLQEAIQAENEVEGLCVPPHVPFWLAGAAGGVHPSSPPPSQPMEDADPALKESSLTPLT